MVFALSHFKCSTVHTKFRFLIFTYFRLSPRLPKTLERDKKNQSYKFPNTTVCTNPQL